MTISFVKKLPFLDTAPAELPGEGAGPSPAVRYQVLCRRHYVRGELGPTPAGPGQLALS